MLHWVESGWDRGRDFAIDIDRKLRDGSNLERAKTVICLHSAHTSMTSTPKGQQKTGNCESSCYCSYRIDGSVELSSNLVYRPEW